MNYSFFKYRLIIKAALIQGLLLFFLGVYGYVPFERGVAHATSKNYSAQEAIDIIISRIKTKFGINIFYQNIPRDIWPQAMAGKAQTKEYGSLLKYISLLEKELNKYPSSFFQKKLFPAIVVVEKFFYKDYQAEGLYDQRRNVIFLEFLRHDQNDLIRRHNIHHEFYHVVEYFMHGPVDFQDERWAGFNLPGFQYNLKYLSEPGQSRRSYLEPEDPGFVTPYARTAIKEDKAEIFACLMVEPQHKLLKRWIGSDGILKNKAAYIKDFISKYCTDMDDGFWARLLGAPA